MRTTLPALPAISRRHLDLLTHADDGLSPPIDVVARTIQVDLLHAKTLGWDAVADNVRHGLTTLEAAFDETTGRFDGSPANDGLGRVMLALGETIAAAPEAAIVDRATFLFTGSLKAAGRLLSLRGQAALVLGCAAVGRAFSVPRPIDPRSLPVPAPRPLDARETMLRDEARAALGQMATRLHARTLDSARPDWPWAESTVTVESALLPRALIVGGRAIGADVMFRIGLQVLDWLIDVQRGPTGDLSLIGAAGWPRTGTRSTFEQLPIDATALLLAAEAAHDATGDPRYAAAMERAYGWFLGANDRGQRLVDPRSGACADGLPETGRDPNHGIDATLAWLTAAEHVRVLRGRAAVATTRSRTIAPAPLVVGTA